MGSTVAVLKGLNAAFYLAFIAKRGNGKLVLLRTYDWCSISVPKASEFVMFTRDFTVEETEKMKLLLSDANTPFLLDLYHQTQ